MNTLGNKQIIKIILVVVFSCAVSMLYAQTVYYWSGGHQINMTINNNKHFIVSEKTRSFGFATFGSLHMAAIRNY